MRRTIIALYLALAAGAVGAKEVVLDVLANGSSVRILVDESDDASATVVLFAGGHGALGITDDGVIGWGRGNFLVRTRGLFALHGLVTAVIDAPSQHQQGIPGDYRASEAHADEVGAVVVHLRERFGLPVWLVGTSRGTVSAANAAARLAGSDHAPDGLVLTATVFNTTTTGPGVLQSPLERITVPVVIAHHREDQCSATPFGGVADLRAALTSAPDVSVLEFGGGTPTGRVCKAYHFHGFRGIEDDVVARIAARIEAHVSR